MSKRFLVLENAGFADVIKKAATVAASRGEAYEKAAGIIIQSNELGVTVRATNLDIFYTEWIDPIEQSDEHFIWRVSSKLLSSVTGALPIGPGKTVTITNDDDKPGYLTTLSNRYRSSLPLIKIDTFPDWGVFDPDIMTETKGFSRAISLVEWAASTNQDPPKTGVHFTGSMVAATNGYRVATAAFAMPTSEPFTIPAGTVGQLVKANGGGEAKLRYDGNRLLVLPNAHTQIQVTAFGAQYPNISRVLTTIPPDEFEVNKEEFLSVLRRAEPLSNTDRTPGIFLRLGNKTISAYAITEVDGASAGDVMDSPGHLDHPVRTYFFIPTNLIAAIETAPDSVIKVKYWLDNPAGNWFIYSGNEYVAIVAPRRYTPKQGEAN